MNLLFRFGKTFASLLAVLCLMSVIVSVGIFVWNVRANMNVPTYLDIDPNRNIFDVGPSSNMKELDYRTELEKEFGDRVASIIKAYKFDQDDYDVLMGMVDDINEDYRSKFVGGLEKALNGRAKSPEKNIPSVQVTSKLFMKAFSEAVSKYESDKAAAKNNRWNALVAVFVSCFMLLMMSIVAALLRIEENTRKAA